eukprot:3514019-Amphidinium_carterae.1
MTTSAIQQHYLATRFKRAGGMPSRYCKEAHKRDPEFIEETFGDLRDFVKDAGVAEGSTALCGY